jgi:hypothetical protein
VAHWQLGGADDRKAALAQSEVAAVHSAWRQQLEQAVLAVHIALRRVRAELQSVVRRCNAVATCGADAAHLHIAT